VSQPPTKLERRARALLHAYPAQYRRDRAEEMIGTLLEAAPPGRSFPAARDTWALIAGGRHARAARNRSLGVRANLRLALILGLSISVSSTSAREFGFEGHRWLTVAAAVLGTVAALAPWLGNRRAATALVIPAAALALYGPTRYPFVPVAVVYLAAFLIALGALAALSGGSPSLPRSWSLLPAAVPAGIVAAHGSFVMEEGLSEYALLLLAAVTVGWLVTDARPALGLSVGFLLPNLQGFLTDLAIFGSQDERIGLLKAFLLQLAVTAPVLLPATWLLYHQARASRRPLPKR
jgi:hypothetical protein